MVKKPKENAIRNALCVIIAFLSGFMKEWLQQSNRPKRQQNGKKKKQRKEKSKIFLGECRRPSLFAGTSEHVYNGIMFWAGFIFLTPIKSQKNEVIKVRLIKGS